MTVTARCASEPVSEMHQAVTVISAIKLHHIIIIIILRRTLAGCVVLPCCLVRLRRADRCAAALKASQCTVLPVLHHDAAIAVIHLFQMLRKLVLAFFKRARNFWSIIPSLFLSTPIIFLACSYFLRITGKVRLQIIATLKKC